MSSTIGQFLMLHRKWDGISLGVLSEKASALGDALEPSLGRSAAFFSSMERGTVDVRPEWVPGLSMLYGIDEPLLWHALARPAPQAVQIDAEGEFRALEPCGAQTNRKEYSIPMYRLEGSNVVMLFLTLHPGERSGEEHRHPGEEIIKVEQGEMILVFPELSQASRERRVRQGELIHFDSRLRHYVENPADRTDAAKLFVIRIFESGTS